MNCTSLQSTQLNESELNEQQYEQTQQKTSQHCDDARLKCAFRLDCGQALISYMTHCADLIAGNANNQCPSKCFKALIALASTEQGSKLVECDCGNSQFCALSKERIEICRSKVEYQIAENTVVSCSIAKLICMSNTQCLTALTYYNKFCRSMFAGKACTKRCLNSLNILQRQQFASKLRTCICDGSEDFACEAIKQNTELLCLKKSNYSSTSIELLNEVHRTFKLKSQNKSHLLKSHHHHKFNFNAQRRMLTPDQFETSPIDLDQIKKNVYFDIMMKDIMISEALSSNSNLIYSNLAFILAIGQFTFFSISPFDFQHI